MTADLPLTPWGWRMYEAYRRAWFVPNYRRNATLLHLLRRTSPESYRNLREFARRRTLRRLAELETTT